VRFLPLLASQFNIKTSLKNSIYAAIPTFTSQLRIKNDSGFLLPLLQSGKFANCKATIYRMSGTPRTENVGILAEADLDDIKIQGETISIAISEVQKDLGKQFGSGPFVMADESTFTPLPQRSGANIKTVMGMARGLRLEVRDYNATINTSNNRNWLVCPALGENQLLLSITANASVSTKLTPAGYGFGVGGDERLYFRLGDRIRITDGTNNEYRVIVRNEAVGSPIPPSITFPGLDLILDTPLATFTSSTATVRRYHAARVFLNQGGSSFELFPDRDYTMSVSSGYIVLTLTSSAESNVGAATVNPNTDFISGTFYGPRYEHTTYNMGATKVRSSTTMPAANHYTFLIYMIFDKIAGLAASKYSVADLEALFADHFSYYSTVSFGTYSSGAIVEPSSSFATRRRIVDVLNDIALAHNLLIYVDIEGVIRVKSRVDTDGANFVVEDKDILGDIVYEHSYSDAFAGARASFERAEVVNFLNEQPGERLFEINSEFGKPLYNSSRVLQFNCPVVQSRAFPTIFMQLTPIHDVTPTDLTGPLTIATNVANVAAMQRNIYKLRLKKKFSRIDFNDTVTIRRERLPGFPYEKGVMREVTGDVVSISRDLNSIEIEIEDRRIRQLLGRTVRKFA
jgi:hypothetical protein